MKSILSKKIKKARKDKGFTLEQLANEIGSSKSYVWQLENSPKVNPSALLILKITEALDITADYLFDTEKEDMTKDDEYSLFFRDFKELDEIIQKGIMAQVKMLKKLKKEKV